MSSDGTDREVIGYVVGDTEEAVTLCTDCEGQWDEEIGRGEIRDGPHYGNQVPYPECYLCEEVMRPDQSDNTEADRSTEGSDDE